MEHQNQTLERIHSRCAGAVAEKGRVPQNRGGGAPVAESPGGYRLRRQTHAAHGGKSSAME